MSRNYLSWKSHRWASTLVILVVALSSGSTTVGAASPSGDTPVWSSLPTLAQIESQLTVSSGQNALTQDQVSNMRFGFPYPDVQENGTQKNCSPIIEDAFKFAPCVYGDATSKRIIAVVGDSEADMWIPTLDIYGKEFGFKIDRFVMDGCTAWKDQVTPALKGWTNCEMKWKKYCVTAINKLRPFAVVVSGMIQDSQSKALVEKPSRIASGIESYFSAIKQSGAKLFMLSNVPWDFASPSTPGTCIFAHDTQVNACDGVIDPTMAAALKLVEQSGVSKVIPIQTLFCSTKSCPIVVGNRSVLFDDHHMTHAWATYIPRAFSQIFNPMLATT